MSGAKDKLPYPSSTQGEYIYKNLPEAGKLTHTNVVFADDYIYEDSLTIPTWSIGTEQKTVAGYTCQKATTEFGGRTWTVWFAPELPISDGPWKLCGLPGLILEAQDAEKHYQFTCIEIERVSDGEPIAVPKKRYSRYSKKEFIEINKLWIEDQNTFIRKLGMTPPKVLEPDGTWKEEESNVTFNYIER